MTPTSASPPASWCDALRGFAVAQMIVYHFIYDLAYFGWINLVMTRDQPWIAWRTAIVTQFLLLVGVSLVLRTSFKPSAADFWKRWAQIAGGRAIGVTLAVGWYSVSGFIYFGILHFVAAALLLARPLLRLKAWNIALGIVCICAGRDLHERVLQHATGDDCWLHDIQAEYRRLRSAVSVDWSGADWCRPGDALGSARNGGSRCCWHR